MRPSRVWRQTADAPWLVFNELISFALLGDTARGRVRPYRKRLTRHLFYYCNRRQIKKGEFNMLWTLAVVLMVLWLLGLVSSITMGGFIHVLLVIAVVMVLVRLIQGRRSV